MRAAYAYQGDATCAADGMCQEKCPVKINTGELIKSIRAEELKAAGAGASRAEALSMVRAVLWDASARARGALQECCRSKAASVRVLFAESIV